MKRPKEGSAYPREVMVQVECQPGEGPLKEIISAWGAFP